MAVEGKTLPVVSILVHVTTIITYNSPFSPRIALEGKENRLDSHIISLNKGIKALSISIILTDGIGHTGGLRILQGLCRNISYEALSIIIVNNIANSITVMDIRICRKETKTEVL